MEGFIDMFLQGEKDDCLSYGTGLNFGSGLRLNDDVGVLGSFLKCIFFKMVMDFGVLVGCKHVEID